MFGSLPRHYRGRILAVVGVATLGSCGLMAASASADRASRCHIHGTILEGDVTGPVSVSGHGNTEIDRFTHPIFFDGSLTGVGIADERATIHSQNNRTDVHARIGFTGNVTCADGRVLGVGGLDINFNAIADLTSFRGHFEVLGGSGQLARTHGHGTVTGVPGVPGGTGTYDGTLD